jgi:hypothetical protein
VAPKFITTISPGVAKRASCIRLRITLWAYRSQQLLAYLHESQLEGAQRSGKNWFRFLLIIWDSSLVAAVMMIVVSIYTTVGHSTKKQVPCALARLLHHMHHLGRRAATCVAASVDCVRPHGTRSFR